MLSGMSAINRENSPRPEREASVTGFYRGMAVGSSLAEALLFGVVLASDLGLDPDRLSLRTNLACIGALVINGIVDGVAIHRGWPPLPGANSKSNLPQSTEPAARPPQLLVNGKLDHDSTNEDAAIIIPGPIPETR